MIMWPFEKKGTSGPGRVPTSRVITLSSQGLSEQEIIRTLKNEGYTPEEVDAAMREALRGATLGVPRKPAPPQPAPPAAEPPAPPSPEIEYNEFS
ncbi:MAG TPA: hypothetical protein ENG00_01305, partial [Candidatus Aenigmarchaeota archaeon]|nr:hypothetical protein [Candidatus Aenigmarchaeota archaeon]